MRGLMTDRVLSPSPHNRRQHNPRDPLNELPIIMRQHHTRTKLDKRKRTLRITDRKAMQPRTIVSIFGWSLGWGRWLLVVDRDGHDPAVACLHDPAHRVGG